MTISTVTEISLPKKQHFLNSFNRGIGSENESIRNIQAPENLAHKLTKSERKVYWADDLVAFIEFELSEPKMEILETTRAICIATPIQPPPTNGSRISEVLDSLGIDISRPLSRISQSNIGLLNLKVQDGLSICNIHFATPQGIHPLEKSILVIDHRYDGDTYYYLFEQFDVDKNGYPIDTDQQILTPNKLYYDPPYPEKGLIITKIHAPTKAQAQIIERLVQMKGFHVAPTIQPIKAVLRPSQTNYTPPWIAYRDSCKKILDLVENND